MSAEPVDLAPVLLDQHGQTIRAYRPQMPRFRSVTAAGKRINLQGRRPGERVLRDPEKWQQDIWTFYDSVAEVKFIGRFYGNTLSRIRLVPAVVTDPDQAPLPIEKAVIPEDEGGAGLPEDYAKEAQLALDRLTSSAEGMSGLMRSFGENLALVGDCYLVGRDATDDDDTTTDEVWQVYSTSAIREDRSTGQIVVREHPADRQGRPLEGDPVIYRIWRRHAQWPALADSNLSACLDECEELLIYSRWLRAIGASGTSAGLLLLPSELDQSDANSRIAPGSTPPAPDGTDQDPATGWTKLEQAVMEQFLNPVQESNSGAAVAPALVRGRAEFLKEVRHLTLERPIDDKILDRIDKLVARLARGSDLPVEVLTGVADANHWTGWQIEDSTYKAHIEPTAQIPAVALTAAYLRPTLIERNVPPEWANRMVFALDPSALVVRPNRGPDARALHAMWVVSDDYLRDAHGVPESAAPSDEELQRRLALARGITTASLTTELLNRTVTEDDPVPVPEQGGSSADDEGTGPPGPTPENPGGEDGGEPTPAEPTTRALAVVAAAQPLPDLGRQLADIERRVRERLQTLASAEMEQALRKAGSRLRGAVQGTPDAERVNGQPAETVGILLGAERAAEVVDPESLLSGAFVDMEPRWRDWTRQAEAEAIAAVNAVTPDDGMSVDIEGDSERDAGWAVLLGALLALAGRRLFAALDDEPGEVDRHSAVPAGIIRDALAVAGGATSAYTPVGTASQAGPGGLLTGPRWSRLLSSVDIAREAWLWQTGFPSHPFEPHQRLGGVVFDTWDDPQLVNASSWPRTGFYYPGDHLGCQCDAIPVLVLRTGGTAT